VGVGGSVKHFAVNNQEAYSFSIDAIVDQRALHEIYLKAFEMIINQSKPKAVMASYNRVNGTYASEHQELLSDLLRKNWGYQGLVISDWGAVSNRVRAFQAGLDIEMPYGLGRGTNQINDAVKHQIIHEDAIDESIQRILTTQEDLKRAQSIHPIDKIDWNEHHQLAKEIALESMVLLKNSSNALPLSSNIRYGIIGELAATPRIQGGGSSHVQAKFVETPLDILRERIPEISFAPGYELRGVSNPQLLQEALQLVENVDQVLLFVGLTDYDEIVENGTCAFCASIYVYQMLN
jgi:beta-glucosidase